MKTTLKVAIPLFLSLAIVLVGCSEKRSDYTSIPLNLRKVARDSIPYSEFVDSITYVDLKTSDNCIIGTISNIRIADGQIVVLDDLSQRVMLFDSIGSYIHDIGSRGLEPENIYVPPKLMLTKKRKTSLYSTTPGALC